MWIRTGRRVGLQPFLSAGSKLHTTVGELVGDDCRIAIAHAQQDSQPRPIRPIVSPSTATTGSVARCNTAHMSLLAYRNATVTRRRAIR